MNMFNSVNSAYRQWKQRDVTSVLLVYIPYHLDFEASRSVDPICYVIRL